ncbi:MAG: FAD-binding protein [Desulfobacteraceae bacterium]|nr:MAG: FAD-binding protein [Desulfobacteraceae bacterium]
MSKHIFETIRTDVLIIGAGAAGIRAAVAASQSGAEVLIAGTRTIANSGSSFSSLTKGWGIQGLVGKERTAQNLEQFYSEIIRIGLGKCDPSLVRILVEESGPRIEDLVSFGLRFKKNDRGEPVRAKGCFSSIERAFLTEDYSNVKETFQSVVNRTNIRFLEGRAIDLIVADDQCWGAWIFTNDKRIVQVGAKSTILATGGGAAVFPVAFAGATEIGDGYTIASIAGAELINMEYIQFMLGLKIGDECFFLPLSQLEQPYMLQDESGDDLLQKYISDTVKRRAAVSERQGHFPFSCRDQSCLVDLAVAEERQKGKKVFWKTDRASDPLEVDHFSHAFNGGLRINEFTETTLCGLFAAGEVAAGPHGADRIGGCMMTATQVFGERAGRFSAARSRKIRNFPVMRSEPDLALHFGNPQERIDLIQMQQTSKSAIGKHLSVLRGSRGLSRCKEALDRIRADYAAIRFASFDMLDFLDLRSILTVGALIVGSALKNPVSTGSHFRIDGPNNYP